MVACGAPVVGGGVLCNSGPAGSHAAPKTFSMLLLGKKLFAKQKTPESTVSAPLAVTIGFVCSKQYQKWRREVWRLNVRRVMTQHVFHVSEFVTLNLHDSRFGFNSDGLMVHDSD